MELTIICVHVDVAEAMMVTKLMMVDPSSAQKTNKTYGLMSFGCELMSI
jgi:hypothetical protein